MRLGAKDGCNQIKNWLQCIFIRWAWQSMGKTGRIKLDSEYWSVFNADSLPKFCLELKQSLFHFVIILVKSLSEFILTLKPTMSSIFLWFEANHSEYLGWNTNGQFNDLIRADSFPKFSLIPKRTVPSIWKYNSFTLDRIRTDFF